MAIAVRDEGKKVSSNINVTPMVDVMLVLLIIFMVITPMLQNKVQIDMAKVDNPDRHAGRRQGRCHCRGRHPRWGGISGAEQGSRQRTWRQVREKLADKPGKTIFVRADARAQYRAVEDAIDAVRTAGVEDVGLLTQKREGGLCGRRVSFAQCAVPFNDFEQTRSFKPWE